MEKTNLHLPEMKVVGISVRTSNAAEMNPQSARIGPTVQKYFQEGWVEMIKARKSPEQTLCIYTHYGSDFTGEYTFLVGEEVNDFAGLEEGLESLVIPAQQYVKFTEQGPIPEVAIQMWQAIWQMSPAELGATRAYVADFQIYRAAEGMLDIYLGIK